MATSIYINTDLKDLTANAVANINRPTQVVRLPQIVEGEVVDVVLHLVKSNGAYDSRSGSGSSVSVAISSRGKAATSGTFTLNAGTATTGALAWNASAEAVEGALNALNSGTGAFGSKVKVTKLGAGSYRVIFDTVGARIDMAGTSLDLGPESEVTAATSVVGSSTIRAQQVIEISQQPAIYTETWTAVGSTWTGQLNANTARVQELIAEDAGAFFEVKIGSDVVCQVPISVLSAVAAPNSLPAHELPGNLDAFAADPSTNGSFNPANWREDLSLNDYAPINDPTFTGTATIPSADITTADFNAGAAGGELSWNNQEKTLDLVTGSDNVTIQLGQEVVLYARNRSGAAMSDGQVVMVDGSQGNNPTISLAQANTVENARKTIGVVTQTIPNNSNGFITLIGKVRDLVLDNGTYSEGDVVYLSDTAAGGLTNIEPAISVEIGHVLATSNGGNTNGVLEVQINNGAGTYELEQTLNAAIATKAPIASPTFTGDLTVGNIEIGESSSSTVVNLLDASNGSDARTSIGLGASDIVEFGGLEVTQFNFPNLTTSELNAVADAIEGDTYFDSDRGQFVRFTGPSSYDVVSTRATTQDDSLTQTSPLSLPASRFHESGLVGVSTDPFTPTDSLTIFTDEEFSSSAGLTYLYHDGSSGFAPAGWLDASNVFGGAVTGNVLASGKQYRVELANAGSPISTAFSFNQVVASDVTDKQMTSLELQGGSSYKIEVVAPISDLAEGNLRFDVGYTGVYTSATVQLICDDLLQKQRVLQLKYKLSENDLFAFRTNSKLAVNSPRIGIYTFIMLITPSSDGVFTMSARQDVASADPLLIDKVQTSVSTLSN